MTNAEYRRRHSQTPRDCAKCGVMFVRNSNESWAAWVKRKYCDAICRRDANMPDYGERERRRKAASMERLSGMALTKALRRRIERQVQWVFAIENGVFLRADLIRQLRATDNEFVAERVLQDAIPPRRGRLLEGTRRRVMQRIKSLGVVGE